MLGAAQIGSVVDRHTAGQLSCILIFTADGSIAPERRNVKRQRPCVVTLGDVTRITGPCRFGIRTVGKLSTFGLVGVSPKAGSSIQPRRACQVGCLGVQPDSRLLDRISPATQCDVTNRCRNCNVFVAPGRRPPGRPANPVRLTRPAAGPPTAGPPPAGRPAARAVRPTPSGRRSPAYTVRPTPYEAAAHRCDSEAAIKGARAASMAQRCCPGGTRLTSMLII